MEIAYPKIPSSKFLAAEIILLRIFENLNLRSLNLWKNGKFVDYKF